MCTARNFVLLIVSTAAPWMSLGDVGHVFSLLIIYHNLFGLLHIQEKIGFFTPLERMTNFIPVVAFITNSCAISKLDNVIGAVGWYTVMGQKGK